MRELEETNCEIRNVINLDIPSWGQLDNVAYQEESATADGLKDSNLPQTCGNFLSSECKYAWLSHEKRLIVVDVRYGQCISTWSFPNKITSVCSFPMEPGQVPLLLIGTDNNAIRIKDSIGYLYVYDCNSSIILTEIQVPAGVEKACIVHGGKEWEEYNEKRPDTVLPGNSGLIFAALRNLQHIVVDVNRLLWQNGLRDGKTFSAKLEFVNIPPTPMSNTNKRELAYSAYDLMDREIEQFMGFDREDFESTPLYDENLCSVLLSSTKTGCLITGCLGRVIIWQSDGSIGWISPPFDENAYVTHVALLEPSDDPRPFYYLWIACQNDSPDSSAVLRMYAMLFNRKHSDKSGESSLYFNLESEPSLKFELELEQGERVHSLIPVERENPRDPSDCGSRRGEDSLLLIGSDERVLLFDLNRWYKEQMPRTMAECRNPNSVMASYRTTPEDASPSKRSIVACCYLPRSLREFPIKMPSSPEELFYPNSLTIEWIELSLDSLTHWLARGVQAELLREVTITGPIVLVKPTEIYRRCLVSGLVPFDSMPQDFPFDADQSEQRQMLLSICLEQRWASFLLRCAVEWSDGSAAYLYPEFLRWGVQRASELKLIADQLCVPLFDQSGVNIGETEVRTLRFCAQQLECLGNVVSHLPNLEDDLERQRRALRRISSYLHALLWFYDVGLLPESQELEEQEDNDSPQVDPTMKIPLKIPYPKEKLAELYAKKRESCKVEGQTDQEGALFIDHMMDHDCVPLKTQWQKEAAGETPNHDGRYPPPSLQTLLRSFLTDCYQDHPNAAINEEDIGDLVETQSKHCITIYLLMDLAMLLQNSHPNVEHLIKYPSAFKLSPSIIKLTQAFWLLDHEDYEGFFDIVTGELISLTDIKDWHHKFAVHTLLQNSQHKLALMYMRILKPPLTSLEEQGIIISLSVGQGLVESAFHARPSSHYNQLLMRFFQSCKAHGKLKEILLLALDTEEEEAFVKFLKENDCEDMRLLYYLQRSRHAEAKDVFNIDTNRNSRRSVMPSKVNPTTLKMLGAFNDTLPSITKHFANTLIKNANAFPPLSSNRTNSYQVLQPQSFMGHASSITSSAQGYPRPMSQCRISANEVYELAVHKTRETCLKAGRVNTSVNYVPFLGAPCSTIVFCTRATGNVPEQLPDANCVLFPERKVMSGKRTLCMMNDGNADAADGTTEKKRRRLGSMSETNLSKEGNNAQLSRRLSMSQVCDTPLVQRKDKDPNNLAIETPHSILKIRQLLQRNSNSPGYNFNMGSNEKQGFLKPSAIGDARPARQIRFSVERSSGNEDSLVSVNENQEKDEQESNLSVCSKNTDEEQGIDEAYYSPNASSKCSRDSSILTDSSVTKYFRGPRPRPSLRRSSLLSHASSDYLSQKTGSSDNSTLNASALDTSQEKGTKASTSPSSPQKSLLSQTIYNASILSPDSSVEGFPFKRPLAFDAKRDVEEESDSEETSEDEEEVPNVAPGRESSLNVSFEKDLQTETDTESMEKNENEMENEDVEAQDETSEKEISILVDKSPLQHAEISDDEETDKVEEQSKHAELEEGECESFQSFSNSMDNAATFEAIVQRVDQPPMDNINDNASDDLTSTLVTRHVPQQDYNLSQCLKLNRGRVFSNRSAVTVELNRVDESSNEEGDYSLTKPIFLDSHGIVKFAEPTPDITDDESMDDTPIKLVELDSVIQSQNEVEGEENDDDLKLNLSSSDDNAPDNEQLISDTTTRTNGLSTQKTEVELSDSSPPTSKTLKRKSTVESTLQTPLSVSPATMSVNVEKESTPLRRSTRRQSSLVPTPSPRRSIKSVASSPAAKANESTESISPSQMDERERRSTSATKEVKKVLSTALRRPSEQSEEDESQRSRSSSLSQASERKLSRTSSRQSSREPSQDKDAFGEALSKSKKATRTTQKESAEQTIATRTRARAGSTATEVQKPIRKTRATSVVKDNPIVLITSADSEILVEEPAEKKTRSRTTRAASASDSENLIDEPTEKKTRSRTRAASVSDSENLIDESTEKKTRSRATRAASMSDSENLIDEPTGKKTRSRATRAASTSDSENLIDEPTEKKTRSRTRAASASDNENFIDEPIEKKTRSRTRVASTSDSENLIDEPTEKKTRSRTARIASTSKDTTAAENVDETEEVAHEEEKSSKTRATRGSSQAKDVTLKPARKTRAGSVAQEEKTPEKPVTARKTRAGSVAQDDDVFLENRSIVTRKTRAGSVAQEDEAIVEKPAVATRKTRAGSVAKDPDTSEEKPATVARKTRAGSVVKDEEHTSGARKTRATSVTKDTSAIEEAPTKRTTRAGSVVKDTSAEEHEETLSKKPARKRGGSVPKDVPAEPSKLFPRSRRSTSLLQEVILEESLSQLESPAGKRSRLPRPVEETAASSPAANTRSRRSSIQSIPEELEEILSVPAPVRVSSKKSKSAEVSDDIRNRRAASVDSKVIVPAGKRVTRSVLAKTAIIEEVIPEEAAAKSPVTKKQPARRKRATSVPADSVEETEKVKPLGGRPKRGRKISENKAFEFSVPEETGELPDDAQGECRTPTYEFSKPAGFQKFISPIADDEETSEMTTNIIKRINAESERVTALKMRRPRTCFVLAKKTKNKDN